MRDPDRLKRVHVRTVRMRGTDRYVVVLSDGSEVDWNTWVRMTREERWNQ